MTRNWRGGNRWWTTVFSVADVYLLMLAHWHPVGDRPREKWTNIVRLCAALRQQPVLAEFNAAHRLW